MDAILFSADPSTVLVDDAIKHLAGHEEIYWAVPFPIVRGHFSYPMYGFIHMCGGQVEYRVSIRDIVPFSRDYHEDKAVAERVKPEPWLREWKENRKNVQARPWKNELVITEIVPFSYDTVSFQKCNGTKVQTPPQSYVRVRPPPHT